MLGRTAALDLDLEVEDVFESGKKSRLCRCFTNKSPNLLNIFLEGFWTQKECERFKAAAVVLSVKFSLN